MGNFGIIIIIINIVIYDQVTYYKIMFMIVFIFSIDTHTHTDC